MDMVTNVFENRGTAMDMDTNFLKNRGMVMDMVTASNRCPPNSVAKRPNWMNPLKGDSQMLFTAIQSKPDFPFMMIFQPLDLKNIKFVLFDKHK